MNEAVKLPIRCIERRKQLIEQGVTPIAVSFVGHMRDHICCLNEPGAAAVNEEWHLHESRQLREAGA